MDGFPPGYIPTPEELQALQRGESAEQIMQRQQEQQERRERIQAGMASAQQPIQEQLRIPSVREDFYVIDPEEQRFLEAEKKRKEKLDEELPAEIERQREKYPTAPTRLLRLSAIAKQEYQSIFKTANEAKEKLIKQLSQGLINQDQFVKSTNNINESLDYLRENMDLEQLLQGRGASRLQGIPPGAQPMMFGDNPRSIEMAYSLPRRQRRPGFQGLNPDIAFATSVVRSELNDIRRQIREREGRQPLRQRRRGITEVTPEIAFVRSIGTARFQERMNRRRMRNEQRQMLGEDIDINETPSRATVRARGAPPPAGRGRGSRGRDILRRGRGRGT